MRSEKAPCPSQVLCLHISMHRNDHHRPSLDIYRKKTLTLTREVFSIRGVTRENGDCRHPQGVPAIRVNVHASSLTQASPQPHNAHGENMKLQSIPVSYSSSPASSVAAFFSRGWLLGTFFFLPSSRSTTDTETRKAMISAADFLGFSDTTACVRLIVFTPCWKYPPNERFALGGGVGQIGRAHV